MLTTEGGKAFPFIQSHHFWQYCPDSPTFIETSGERNVCMPFQFSRSVVPNSLQPHGLQYARPPCPSPEFTQTHVHWVSDAIQPPSVVPFSTCLQSFPPSGSFPMSQLFASSHQSIGVSASASVHPTNIQDWFPLGWTGWISLLSKGLSRVVLIMRRVLSEPC